MPTNEEWKYIVAAFSVGLLSTRCLLGARKLSPAKGSARKGRYVRISRDRSPLEVAEVQVYDASDTNVAPLYAKVSQSSIKDNDNMRYGPNTVIDGNIAGSTEHGEVATTKLIDPHPMIELDLGYDVKITRITVFLRDQDRHPNPSSEWFTKHCKNIKLEVLCAARTVLWRATLKTWQRIYDFPLQLF
jgi:hypothetical protein